MAQMQEKAEKLAARTGVTLSQASAALEHTGGDLLGAALLLERRGAGAPVSGGFFTTRPGGTQDGPLPTSPLDQNRQGSKKDWKVQAGGLLRALLDVLRHCTVNQLEVWRKGELLTSVPVIILIMLLVVAIWVSIALLVIGAIAGCEYRFSGPELDAGHINSLISRICGRVRDVRVYLWWGLSSRHSSQKKKK